uniref:Tho2 domain-containing protein n=1 Tax=Caenorhabditis japonica TaxID=281687 RepID=A0A8R1E7B7_CAEJA
GKSKKADKNLESKLREEQKKQTEHVERVRAWLANKKDDLIEEARANVILEFFIQQCILPRALFSELDAVFCAQFFFLIHEMRILFFPTVLIMDRMLENVAPLIAGLTENEANSLARFLEILLVNAQKWHAEKDVFEKECVGFPGMITKSSMDYQTFRKLCYRWQVRLGKLFVTVLGKEDADYVLIRNCLILMTKLTPAFPLLSSTITQMESAAAKLRDREKGKRDDLSLMGASYIGRLKLRNVKIYAVPSDFAPVQIKKTPVIEKIVKKKPEEKADGEPADKKPKVEAAKNGKGKEAAENGTEKSAEKTEETKERKKRPVVSFKLYGKSQWRIRAKMTKTEKVETLKRNRNA